jgi:MFS family permease
VLAGLVNRLKSAAVDVVLKYVARASVIVPFVIAVVFALAAITAMLVDRFGHVIAYWLVAAGLTVIGAIAAVAVSVKEKHEEEEEQKSEEADTGKVVSDATAQALVQAPIALFGALLTTQGGGTSALKVARLAGRNLPLVMLLLTIGVLFWPAKSDRAEDAGDGMPNGSEDLPSTLRY